jgi:hypothetical protein
VARKPVIRLALVFALSGMLIGAVLTSHLWGTLGPIPEPAGEAFGRKVSPDGRWIVQSYVDELDWGWVTVEPAGGGVRRTVYHGEPANASWRDGHIVVTDQASGAQHVIDVGSGTWDYRVDEPVEFYGSKVIVAVIIVLVLAFDVWWLRRWTRRFVERPASMDPCPPTHLVQE